MATSVIFWKWTLEIDATHIWTWYSRSIIPREWLNMPKNQYFNIFTKKPKSRKIKKKCPNSHATMQGRASRVFRLVPSCLTLALCCLEWGCGFWILGSFGLQGVGRLQLQRPAIPGFLPRLSGSRRGVCEAPTPTQPPLEKKPSPTPIAQTHRSLNCTPGQTENPLQVTCKCSASAFPPHRIH